MSRVSGDCALQHTAQHTATHCNTLQHTATHCNTLQHAATHCNTHFRRPCLMSGAGARPCDNPAPVLQRLSRFQRCSVQVPGVCVCARVCACVRVCARVCAQVAGLSSVAVCKFQVWKRERPRAHSRTHAQTWNLELAHCNACALQRFHCNASSVAVCKRSLSLEALPCASSKFQVCACVRVCARVCACVCVCVHICVCICLESECVQF